MPKVIFLLKNSEKREGNHPFYLKLVVFRGIRLFPNRKEVWLNRTSLIGDCQSERYILALLEGVL